MQRLQAPSSEADAGLEVLRPDRVIRQDWASTLITREALRRFDDRQEEGGFLQGLDLVIDRRFEHGNLLVNVIAYRSPMRQVGSCFKCSTCSPILTCSSGPGTGLSSLACHVSAIRVSSYRSTTLRAFG